MKAIILYCSRSGNTEALAHRVCQTISCDTLKVEPKEPYGNYLQSILRVRKERKKRYSARNGYSRSGPFRRMIRFL